jgi:excisionase family DNA binding protein
MTIAERLRGSKRPLTVKEVANTLGYHVMTVYEWTKEGKVPYMRIGSRIKFDPGALAVWMETRTFR